MSSIDRRQGPGTAPRALGPASDSAHPSSSERGEADGGAGPRAQDYDCSRSYSAGGGPQYGEPGGSSQSQYGVPDWYTNPQYGEPGGSGPQYGQPDGYGQSQYGAPDWYTNPQYGQPDGYGRFEYGQGGYHQPPRQLLIVVILALFAGLFGLHNFYLGHTNRGLVQLLVSVCTLGFAAPFVWLWAVVELILIVTRSGSYAFDAFGRPLV